MSFAIRVDAPLSPGWAELDAKLARLGSEDFYVRVARLGAPIVHGLLQRTYGRQASPEGRRWAPRKSGGSHPIGHRTGRMRRATKATAEGPTIAMVVDTPYASYFDGGTRNMAARPIVPERKLPREWERALAPAVEAATNQIMGDVVAAPILSAVA